MFIDFFHIFVTDMANEILIYSPIVDFTAESFITQLNELDGEDVTVRINSPGGSVFAGWGMIAKSKEYEGKIKIKVDGNASSMAAVFLLFHQNVEALNVSKFTLHRASTFAPTAQEKELLDEINSDIRKAFERKLNIPLFEQLAGASLDEFFGSDDVIDVDINAEQAAAIGLIQTINPLEQNTKAFNDLSMKFAAMTSRAPKAEKPKEEKTVSNKQKSNKMTIEELKSQHPDMVAAIKAEGFSEGVASERDRASAWMEFGDIDFEAVKSGINEGNEISRKVMAELTKKEVMAQRVAEATEESAPEVETPEVPTNEPSAVDTFLTQVRNIKK